MRILFLFSDTGGGHRAAARAIIAALNEQDPSITVDLVDGLVEGGTWPLNRAPAIYRFAMNRARFAWRTSFAATDGRRRARWMADLGYPCTAPRIHALLDRHPADLVVSDHPLMTRTIARTLAARPDPPPFAVVVTDLVDAHWSWFEPSVDQIFVPLPPTAEKAAAAGIPRSRIALVGQPVHPDLPRAVLRRDALRTQLGWKELVVLMVGGGDGTGGLGARARAVAEIAPDARVVVVCGRNERLRGQLSAVPWSSQVDVLGFVTNLHELMAAADILVTKGGPGSIMEGCVAELPMLLYDYLPGQERGNVVLAESQGFGRYFPTAAGIAQAVRHWLDHPEQLNAAKAASRAAATSDAAERIAQGLRRLLAARGRRSDDLGEAHPPAV